MGLSRVAVGLQLAHCDSSHGEGPKGKTEEVGRDFFRLQLQLGAGVCSASSGGAEAPHDGAVLSSELELAELAVSSAGMTHIGASWCEALLCRANQGERHRK